MILTGLKKQIHERAVQNGNNFKRAESDVIGSLQEVEESLLFLDLGLGSLHQYAMTIMKLSSDVASNCILAARKSTQIPVLKEALLEGSVSISQIRKAASVLTLEKQEDWPKWVEQMKTLSGPQLERAVAKENPRAAVPESVKYVSEDRLELRAGISQSMLEKLRRIQDLESKRTGRSANIEDALDASFDAYLEKNDPIKRAERATAKKTERPGRMDGVVSSGNRAIPARSKHQVILRDRGQCTHQTNGKRCENKRFTDIHHIVPRWAGGDNSVGNLITLCSAHHKMVHRN